MNIAILHYHLNRGGVTSVIANHLRSLDSRAESGERVRVAIVYGGEKTGWDKTLAGQLENIDLSFCAVPEFQYDRDDKVEPQPGLLAGRLSDHLEQAGFAPDDTILHVHNHALGKNVSVPGAIEILALSGYALLLQIHDFAEDGRPAVYRRLRESLMARDPAQLSTQLYPQGRRVHYAVLNGRDEEILLRAGVDERRLHSLPNPSAEFDGLPPHNDARRKLSDAFGIRESERLLLLPVRCIRRKNIGEALLWSALFPESVAVGLTLPPLNPVEQPRYQYWKDLAAKLGLRCVFEMGAADSGVSFFENLAAADAILTTSVAEGFGMVFLETWFAGCPLIGRDLPEITSDFKDTGLRFDHLQPRLRIPADDGLDVEFRERFQAEFRRSLSEYVKNESLLNELLDDDKAPIEAGHIDFARLDSALQRRVIERTATDPAYREQILKRNPWMSRAVAANREEDAESISRNADIVRRQYSLEGCGRRLVGIYRALLEEPHDVESELLSDGGRILGEFLSPFRFHPIRTEE